MPIDDEFQNAYPNLSEELSKSKTQKYRIDGVRHEMRKDEESNETEETFVPDVVDYIRRCDNVSQAYEIVEYMLNRGDITKSKARDIRNQLKNDGLRSFGAKKEKGHYLRFGLEE